MTQDEVITSTWLGDVIIDFIHENSAFRDILKSAMPDIAADVESAAVNVNCSCRNRVKKYVSQHNEAVGTLFYQFLSINNLLSDLDDRFKFISETLTKVQVSNISGKVAKTTITDWPAFASNIRQSNFTFDYMSTSIVGDDVYVFFL